MISMHVNFEDSSNSTPTKNCTTIDQNMHEKFRKFRGFFDNRSILVDLFAIFFGIGTWVGINGTFIQLPNLVEEAPEGWSLPSYLSIIVQIGNLGPITYTLIQKFSKNKTNDANMIYILLAIGTTSSLLTAFLYNKTAFVFGSNLSVALFVLTFCTSLNACTSSVLFMPYMGRFKEIYLITYFIGEGLSGLLPSVVALIQGIGSSNKCIVNVTESNTSANAMYTSPPNFGTTGFFLFIFAMMLCSCIGFTLLDRLSLAKRQYAGVQAINGNEYIYDKSEQPTSAKGAGYDLSQQISTNQYKYLLFLIGVVSFFSNGMFNSIQSYSCLPYGTNAYHLAATLSAIANPVSCFLAVFLPHTSIRSVLVLSGIGSVLMIYVFVTAAMSPTPVLVDTSIGSTFVITTWTLLVGIVSYVKLCISSVMRAQGGKSLFWTGCLTQLGSTIGSVLIFILINVTNSFTAYYGVNDC